MSDRPGLPGGSLVRQIVLAIALLAVLAVLLAIAWLSFAGDIEFTRSRLIVLGGLVLILTALLEGLTGVSLPGEFSDWLSAIRRGRDGK